MPKGPDVRLAGRGAALTRTLALQRLEGAAQRWLGPQAAYPSHTRARWNSRWSGDSVGLPAGQDGKFITPTPYVGAGMGHQVVTWCAGRVIADVLGMRFAHTPVAEPWESHLNLAAGGEHPKLWMRSQFWSGSHLRAYSTSIPRFRRDPCSFSASTCFPPWHR